MAKLCLRHSEVFEETVVVTVQFTHECVEFSTVIPRLQCLLRPDTSLASILSPLSPSHHQQKQQKISHFPPSVVRRHNRRRSAVTTTTRQGRQLICIPLSFSRRFIKLHCDVHVTAENKRTLPPFESLASLSIAMAFSRQRPIRPTRV